MEACASDNAIRNNVILSNISVKGFLFSIKRIIDNDTNKMHEVINASE